MAILWGLGAIAEVYIATKYAMRGDVAFTVLFCFASYICYDNMKRKAGGSNG